MIKETRDNLTKSTDQRISKKETRAADKNIQVLIKSYDSKILDETAKRIAATLRKIGLFFSGPVPLPVKRKSWTFLTSPHVNKDARQTFELKDRKRLIAIQESRAAVSALHGIKDIHPAVDIEIRIKNKEGNE